MEKVYNKLIRDNIPSIIKRDGRKATTRILDDEEYKIELYKKLLEEANEVIGANNSEEVLEEMADVLEVLRAIAVMNNKSIEDIINIAKQKRLKRGGFEKRIFLEKTSSKEEL